jgi:hypothetical protein
MEHMNPERQKLFRMYDEIEKLASFDRVDIIEARDGAMKLYHAHGGTTIVYRDGTEEKTEPTNQEYWRLFKLYGNPEPALKKWKTKFVQLFGGVKIDD